MADLRTATTEGPTSVRTSVVVRAPIDRAFQVFTAEMTAWWPGTHHIGTAPMVAAIMEPRPGGRWYELGDDGSECDWGLVLEWRPPHHVALSWHLDGDFRYDPEARRSSRIDVRFEAQPDGSTLVQLEHTGLDRHGPTWQRLRASVSSGWPTLMQRFVESVGA